jgi:site-specific recombinase XerD
MNLEMWRVRFREHLELRHWSPRTIEGYVRELGSLFDFLAAHGVEDLSALTTHLVEEYRSYLLYATYRGRTLAISTQCSRMAAVKQFTAFLARAGFMLLDVGARVPLPRTVRRLPRALLSEKEVARLLEAPDVTTLNGIRDRAILEAIYSCGIRNSELRALELDDVRLESRQLRVRCGKGSKSRMVPLGEEAVLWLGEYLAHVRRVYVRRVGDRTFFLTSRGLPFTRAVLARVVRDLAQSAGLGPDVGPHTLRHACATHMLKRGASVRHIQELIGHVSLTATERYLHLEISDLQRVHRRCHPRERRRS